MRLCITNIAAKKRGCPSAFAAWGNPYFPSSGLSNVFFRFSKIYTLTQYFRRKHAEHQRPHRSGNSQKKDTFDTAIANVNTVE